MNTVATPAGLRWRQHLETRHEPLPHPACLDPAGDHRRPGLAPPGPGPRLRAGALPRLGLHHQPALGLGGRGRGTVRAVAAVVAGGAAAARLPPPPRAAVARPPGLRPRGAAPGPLRARREAAAAEIGR